jgi:hypothetical protein
LGKRSARHQCGPDGGQGGVETDAGEERVHGVDPTAVREAVGEAPVVEVWRQSMSERAGGGEIIVARVRV